MQFLFSGKTPKKDSFAWKLLLVLLIGLCGLSICFVRVGQKNVFTEAGIFGRQAVSIAHCPNLSQNSTKDIQLHYPKPRRYQREECFCTPVHFFVILSMQRSGSGWFETLLNDHPNISSHGEIFGGRERQYWNFTFISKRLDSVYNLDYKSSAAKNECTSAVGFKWMLNQGVMEYHREILSYFRRRGVSVIFLLRRNLLRRLVSILANAYDKEMKLLNGTHKSHVHSKEEANTLAYFKPVINHQALSESFHHIVRLTGNALKAFNSTRHTVVYYEDLVERKEMLEQIQEFLGVPILTLRSQQVKIHTKPLSDQIRNWDIVYDTLNGTEFEKFLVDTQYT
ncbi:hypothetical protein KP509_11G082400 [Ceratopteris richardii]|uniref:Sulfotransferase n=1 Tax=Ceratopteris richardii TaxID=49495 RepID=A0A8T2U031_CERRI|nr:hypothetical protein KP509_11G082400 [Ceratopteris richardii]